MVFFYREDGIFMKIFKKTKKFNNIRYVYVVILLFSLILFPVTAIADDWPGWTDEKKDEAWAVYLTTDWQQIDGIYFSNTGSYASADVDEDFRESYEPLVVNVLEGEDNGLYSSEEYKELLLAIIYVLNDWEYWDDDDIDVCLYEKYIDNTVSIQSPEMSVQMVYRRLLDCEQAYSSVSSEPASIYNVNNNLGSIIQGVVYGREYTESHVSYYRSNASDYYDAHRNRLSTDHNAAMNKFAERVMEIYGALEAGSHTVVG